jgi:hypothetical protein
MRDQENAASATETAQTGWLFQNNVLNHHPGASRHPSCPGGAMPDRLIPQVCESLIQQADVASVFSVQGAGSDQVHEAFASARPGRKGRTPFGS